MIYSDDFVLSPTRVLQGGMRVGAGSREICYNKEDKYFGVKRKEIYVNLSTLYDFFCRHPCSGGRYFFGRKKSFGHLANFQRAVCIQFGFSLLSGGNDLCSQHAVPACSDPDPAPEL